MSSNHKISFSYLLQTDYGNSWPTKKLLTSFRTIHGTCALDPIFLKKKKLIREPNIESDICCEWPTQGTDVDWWRWPCKLQQKKKEKNDIYWCEEDRERHEKAFPWWHHCGSHLLWYQCSELCQRTLSFCGSHCSSHLPWYFLPLFRFPSFVAKYMQYVTLCRYKNDIIVTWKPHTTDLWNSIPV